MGDEKYIQATTMYYFRPFVFVKRNPQKMYGRNKAPKPRSGHRIVCDESNLYSFGGYNPSITDIDSEMIEDLVWLENKPLFKELWRFNFATNTWKRLTCLGTLPDELASNAVFLKGSTLMVYGGTGYPFGSTCSNELFVCNLKKNYSIQYVEVAGSIPPMQYGQALTLDGSYLYTVGGTTGFQYSADIHRLDLRNSVWEEVFICKGRDRSEPHGRYRHELAFDGTRIYLLGGGTAEEVYGFQDIPTFNLKTGAWEYLTTRSDPDSPPPGVPAPRRCHGCVQLLADSNTVFIVGGYNGEDMFGDVWRLELPSLQWTCMTRCSLPQAVYFHSTAITPAGCLYTFGGITEVNGDTVRTADVHSAWVCIPKLSEICWEAVRHYNPNLHLLPKDKLLDSGLPLSYVSRIH